MKQEHKDRRAALLARSSDRVLVDALRALGARRRLTADQRTARTWLIEELERRHPAASAAVEAAFDAAETTDPPDDVDYVAVLTANIPDGE